MQVARTIFSVHLANSLCVFPFFNIMRAYRILLLLFFLSLRFTRPFLWNITNALSARKRWHSAASNYLEWNLLVLQVVSSRLQPEPKNAKTINWINGQTDFRQRKEHPNKSKNMKIAFVGRELSDLYSIDAQNAKEMRFQLFEYLTIKWDIRLELNITENEWSRRNEENVFICWWKKMCNIKIVKLIRSFWMLLMVLANQPNYSFCCTFPILERFFFRFCRHFNGFIIGIFMLKFYVHFWHIDNRS